MAKTETPEPQKAAPPPAPEKKKPKKQKLEVPPMVELTIAFSRSAFILVSILVALISYSAGCDLQTIFARTMVAMIITGLILWLISWWVMQIVIENQLAEQKEKQGDSLPDEGLLKDMKA
jgi:hypothetical protein